jgi:hypothetical protein
VRGKNFWRAALQFSPQVFPFVQQLAVGFRQFDFGSAPTDFENIKLVAAANCFFMHSLEIGRDGGNRICVRAEAAELRMMLVTFRFSAQDFLGQQCFAPKRNEAFGIEIFWVKSP